MALVIEKSLASHSPAERATAPALGETPPTVSPTPHIVGEEKHGDGIRSGVNPLST